MTNPYYKRDHHYIFAYYALRESLEADPAKMVQLLTLEGKRFLLHIWDMAGKNAVEQRGAEYLEPDGLEMEIYRLKSARRLILVKMPTPAYGTEAYYIGIVVKVILIKSKSPKSIEVPRYFTHEFSRPPGQSSWQEPTFAFCEWMENRARTNYGFYKDTAKEAFIELILNTIGDEMK
jgi:hypothetical protein